MKSCAKKKIMSFVGVTFGVIADCDLGSEWLRFMGYIRSYLYVVGRDGFNSAASDKKNLHLATDFAKTV